MVLQVEGLGFDYPECKVFAQWSMGLPAGLALARGDESSGKTTLLRLLAGELAPRWWPRWGGWRRSRSS